MSDDSSTGSSTSRLKGTRTLIQRKFGGRAPDEARSSGMSETSGDSQLVQDTMHRAANSEVPDTLKTDTAVRVITFWRQGFQFEDGELLQYGEPANAAILAQIQAGNAPMTALNVREGQLVELRVKNRTNEDYVQLD